MFKALAILFASNVPHKHERHTNFVAVSFNHWASYYGKRYSASEYDYRNTIFNTNVRNIYKHNVAASLMDPVGWMMTVNKFADLTPSEFKRLYTMNYTRNNTSHTNFTVPVSALPASVDWTDKGVVTPVKDGQYGWAFSATGAMEGAWAISKKQLFNLSEQELIDCSAGTPFEYVVANGLATEEEYPYRGVQNACHSDTSIMTITGAKSVPNSETALLSAIVQQPVSVAVDAQHFQFYSGGVMNSACGTNLDHGVLAVGYGTAGQDYYKLKNSWSTDWGTDGYILLGRGPAFGAAGQCGIQMDASFPVV